MTYTEYDENTLKHLQNVERMILKDFISFCNENDIEYFLYGGSLIGAIRHQDFIPWDDDIDVIMFRKEYEKFVETFEKSPQDKYELLSPENTPDYFLILPKVVLKGTKFAEWWDSQVSFDLGIFLDIFLLDDAPEKNFLRKIRILRTHILNRFIAISVLKFENYPKLTQITVNCLHYLLKTLKISPSFFKNKINKSLKKYQKSNHDEVFCLVSYKYQTIYEKKDFRPSKKAKFGDLIVDIPNKYDKILRIHYGDYMKLPPKSERINHVTYNLNFGDYIKQLK